MKKSRFSASQIVAILEPHEAGVFVAELHREHNMSTGWSTSGGRNLATWMRR